MVFIRLVCKNDRNGNPRRVYIAVSDGKINCAVDEGYEGTGALARLPGNSGQKYTPVDIETTPAEYRRILREYDENGRKTGRR
jgi:hypothetical protein